MGQYALTVMCPLLSYRGVLVTDIELVALYNHWSSAVVISSCPQAFASVVRSCMPAGAKILCPAGAAAL